MTSLSNVAKWLGRAHRSRRRRHLPGFAADQLLIEGGRVVGVRTGDMGVDRHGKPKPNYQPGMDVFAKVTVIGEGVRGTLAKQLIERFDLAGQNPQTYETGVKEIWRIDPKKHVPGRVVHGMAVPRDPEALPRHVALRHEGQPDLLRIRDDSRVRESESRSAPRGAEVQDDAVDALAARGRGAGALRRQGDPGRRALRAAEALHRRRACWSATRRASATRRTSPGSTWR